MLASITNWTIGFFVSSLILTSSGSIIPVENKTKSDSQEVVIEPAKKKTYTRYYSVLTTPGNWTWTDQEPENMECGPNPETFCFIDSDVVPLDNDVPSDEHIDAYGPENSSYQ